jgi:protein-disulfide isomerase
MKRMVRAALALGMAVLAIGATPNWNNEVIETAAGHRVGNPDAKVKLIAFESYTCPACGNFERQGEGALRIVYIHSGDLSLEVRHIIRDPVDLTVAMLTNCGAPSKFFANHAAFMLGQASWLNKVSAASESTQSRWTTGAQNVRRRNIAQDLGLYTIMANRGYERVEVDRCLNDNTKADAMAKQSAANGNTPGFDGTPSFMINGTMLEHVHGWRPLQQQIDQRL